MRGMRRAGQLPLAVAVVVLLALVVLALSLGDLALGPVVLARTLVGAGDATAELVLFRLRLPRVVVGVLVGVGFGIAGAIFQAVLRNPLASPDVLGISGGASVAAVTAMLVLGWTGPAVSAAALVGAAAAAAAIAGLAWRDGIVGYRFVLIGVAIAMLVNAVLGYVLTRADVRGVADALVWMVGSTASVRWREIALVAGATAVVLPAVALARRSLSVLQLGDDLARGLGVRVDRQRLVLLGAAVTLVAVGTAVVGPIAFVAFVAAPIARRLLGAGSTALALAGAVGAVIVTAADVVGQHLLPGGVQVPVGIVTGLVGAPYLLWLLATANRTAGEAS